MSEDGSPFLTRTRLIAGTVAAVIGAGVAFFGPCRGAIEIYEVPTRLEVHELEAQERMKATEVQLERIVAGMERARLGLCEQMGLFPSECPQFTIEHEGEP